MEDAPKLFDGGVDWEGTYVDRAAPNILTDLPPAVMNFPAYVASGFDPNSAAAQEHRGSRISAGHRAPDAATSGVVLAELLQRRTGKSRMCQWQQRFDPDVRDIRRRHRATTTIVSRLTPATSARTSLPSRTTGKIKRPLITVAGTMDALLPIKHHARAYARKSRQRSTRRARAERQRDAQYRLYEVQNGNHIETYKDDIPPTRADPAARAEGVRPAGRHVEKNAALPPSQCIPRGGAISDTPAQAGTARSCSHRNGATRARPPSRRIRAVK